jgi:hypothetical protein
MALLSDFVVLDASEAERVGKSINPTEEFGGFHAKGMDGIKLGTLFCILSGTPCTTDFVVGFMGDQSMIHIESEDGPWVQLVPQKLTLLVADLQQPDLRRIAAEWGKTEEFDPKYSHWQLEDIQEFLAKLGVLARRAVGEKKPLLMWIRL